jgi:hypothetical protein
MPPRAAQLELRAEIEGLSAGSRRQTVFVPALAPFEPAAWPLVGLLPVLDINGTLRSALAARRPFGAAPPVAGIFACDPFLRVADLAAGLRAAGIATVTNFPTVQGFEGETAAALGTVGYRVEAELRVLQRFAERGLSAIACVTDRHGIDVALDLGFRRILLHPGIAPRPDPAAWWADLAGHVAIEGGEALAWRDDAAPQLSRPKRRMRL